MTAPAGTGKLLRVAFRRDRIMMPVWLYGLIALGVGAAYSTKALYDTAASRADFANGVAKNPALLAMYGKVYDVTSVGALSIWKTNGTGAALVAVMSVLFVVRHTRADEESGRLELVSAGVVGRGAALTAALLTALTANLTIALIVAVGLVLVGFPAAGSIAFALAWFGIGMAFAAVGAVAAQLPESSRTANGIAFAVLGVAYLIRSVSDASHAYWLAWLSPFGWMQQVRPFAGDRWWALAFLAAFIALCIAAAYALVARRDVGAGLIPARLGPATGAVRGPFALAWRLQRGTLLAWAVGFVVYGLAIGSVVDSAGDLVNDSKTTRDVITRMGGAHGLVDSFITSTMGIMALLAAIYAVQAVLRLRTEETSERAEPVLATRVGRIGWAAGHLTFALLGSALLMGISGLLTGLVHGVRAGSVGTELPRVLGAAFVQLPAVWVVVAITVVLYGLSPRLAPVGWAVIGVALFLGQLGPVFKLKQWAMDVSPFTHVPKAPGTSVTATPLVWLVLVAALLTAGGLAGLRRRDMG